MSFNSLSFAIFFPVILLLLRMTEGWIRLSILLAGNILFLAVLGYKHVAFMANVILISYFSGVLIEKYAGKKRQVTFLVSSIILATAPLIYFKYFGFISCLGNLLTGKCSPTSYTESYSMILPLGISFYTLQGISYIFDVHYARAKCEKNFLYFANFKSFFPQLVAGPIERVNTLLPQLKSDFRASTHDLHIGFAILLWGFFKKIVIADNLTAVVDPVFSNPHNFTSSTLAIAVLAFTIQIYCDFSGYTNIATGAARMLGIRLSINFNNPYFANSITNFWHRWHISLSTWFRDYIYLPMGGNKHGAQRMYLGLILVFLLSGIWHGANFTFILWAGLHLLFILLEKMNNVRRKDDLVKPEIKDLINWGLTLSIVMVGWIFFRSKSVADAGYIIKSILSSAAGFAEKTGLNGINSALMHSLSIGLIAALFMFSAEYIFSKKIVQNSTERFISSRKSAVVLFALLLTILVFGNFGRSSFIYFQF